MAKYIVHAWLEGRICPFVKWQLHHFNPGSGYFVRDDLMPACTNTISGRPYYVRRKQGNDNTP